MRQFLCSIVAAAILSTGLDAQLVPPSPDDYDAVLVPLAPPDVPGAQGSVWGYEFAALNSGTETLVGYYRPVPGAVPLPDIFPAWNGCRFPICSLAAQFPPGATNPFVLGGELDNRGQSGMLLYVRKSATPSFKFQLRIKDLTRSVFTVGAELQPVPVRELVNGPVHLLNVPGAAAYRLTLRVYDPIPFPDNAVEIKVIDQESGELLSAGTFPLRQPEDPIEDFYPGFPRHPDFLQLSDLQLPPGAFFRARIEVASLTGRPIWAFVSVTNNQTQEVTIVTPY